MLETGGQQCCCPVPHSASGGVISAGEQNACAEFQHRGVPAIPTTYTKETGGATPTSSVGPRRRGAHHAFVRREAFTVRQADGAAAPYFVATSKTSYTGDAGALSRFLKSAREDPDNPHTEQFVTI